VVQSDRGADARLEALATAAEAVLQMPSAAQLLDSAASLVAMSVPCTFATVVAPAGGVLDAIAASDPSGLRFERLQIHVGEGPSLDAATDGIALSVDDLTTETRWTRVVPAAIAAGVRSVLSVAIGGGTGAALSLYAGEPGAFGHNASAHARRFAHHIRLVLGTMELHEQDVAIVEQLRVGLESRTVIGQAQGIVMERERITAEAAFEILRTASQHTNVKLREIATRVVETGEVPRRFAAD